MDIIKLFDLVEEESDSELVAATIVVRDQNQKDIRVYSMNESGGINSYNIKDVL